MIDNFGTRFQRQEMVGKFFNVHKEENATYQKMVETYEEMRDNLDEFEYYDKKALEHIKDRLEMRTNCPICTNELLNKKLTEKYCPACYE